MAADDLRALGESLIRAADALDRSQEDVLEVLKRRRVEVSS